MRPLKVFCSYSHRDERLLRQLLAHLSNMKRSEVIESWTDAEIKAGGDWRKEISDALRTADVILLLVSADFMASDFCQSVELKQALERHEEDRTLIIPVLLRPCDINGSPIERLQWIPRGKPVTEWTNRDVAFTDVVERIRTALSEFQPGTAEPAKRHIEGQAVPATSRVQDTLTRVLGPSEFHSARFLQLGMLRAHAVARIESANGQGICTGGLVRLSDLGVRTRRGACGILTIADAAGSGFAGGHFELSGHKCRLGPVISERAVQGLGAAAVFAVEGVPASIEPLPLGSVDEMREGDAVFLVSYPLGGSLAFSLRDGRVVATSASEVEYHCATAPGCSGAPVFNEQWEVVGIHHRRNAQGTKSAIAIDEIRLARRRPQPKR